MQLKPVEDRLQYAVSLGKRLTISESQDSEAECIQYRRALRISRNGLRLEVLPTIQFDDQLRFNAREVGKVRTDGALPAELASCDLPVAQTLPNFLLRFG